MAERIIQRIVMPPRRGLARLYYRFDKALPRPRRRGRRTIVAPRGTTLRTDTWFNAFFESYWRQYTHLSRLALQVRVSGAGTLRLYRRDSCRAATVRERLGMQYDLLREIDFCGQDRHLRIELADAPPLSDRFGLLFFEIEAHSSPLVMHQAEWTACGVAVEPTRLVASFCTFNRASHLIRNVADLVADPDVADLLEAIIVVDQGSEKVRDHPDFAAVARAAAGRLHLVEQDNRGGSGGFTRCLLEAQSMASATHVLLMDDDIVLEPESVLRTAAFLSLARGDVAVGGHMLDRSRPRQLVESGRRYLPEQVRIDEPSRRRLDRAGDLTSFLEPQQRHYNGWWFFAFPLAVLERTGLPLPLFLRGDDLEFGCRLMRRGVPTVSLPGVAVWHESLQRKSRGCHAFYELRNLLIVGALHFPIIGAATVARRFLSRLLDELLAYDYCESWLMCEAAAAYLHGPEALRHPSHAVQQRLQAMAASTVTSGEWRVARKKSRLLSPLTTHHSPLCESLATLRAWRWRLVLHNLLRASPSSETGPQWTLQGSGEQWYNIAGADVVGVEESDKGRLLVLRRSRGHFVRLFFRGLWLAIRLLCGHRRAVRRWRASVETLASRDFWMESCANSKSSTTTGSISRTSNSAAAACRSISGT